MSMTFAQTRADKRRTELAETAMSAALADVAADLDPTRGEFIGDGIPRTAEGIPYDPLTGATGIGRITFTSKNREYRLVSPGDVETRELAFLWYPWLRPGLNIIAGYGGSRKSTFAAYVAAQATKGKLTDQHGNQCKPTHVLYIHQGEDDVNSVLAPRLLAQGCDPEYTHLLQISVTGMFGTETTVPASAQDLEAIKRMAMALKPGLVIIDPLALLVNGDINSAQDVQPVLVACNELAALTDGAAILGLHHWNKNGGFTGSQKFQDTARSFMEIAIDPTDDTASILTLTKANNSGKPSTRLTAALADWTNKDGTTSKVQIISHMEATNMTVEDLRAIRANGDDAEDLNEIDTWCLTYLRTHNGKALSTEVYEAGHKAGYSRDQLKRAGRRNKNIDVRKDAHVLQGRWCWTLKKKDETQ